RDGIEAAIRAERERVREEATRAGGLAGGPTAVISECAERRKVKFATATLHGRALTWWNSQVATLGLEVANGKPWTEEEEEEKEESEKKGSKEVSEMGSNSESSGDAASDNEVESDLESTTRSEPKCKEMEDTYESGVRPKLDSS
ncbi:hypothetical protein Tco_0996036, partial [Tanacetum coccineum]